MHAQPITIASLKEYDNLELLARQMVEGFITGLHKSPYHGFSVEFAEHRLYNNGESTRHVDWKLFAKTDRLFTKRYEEETNLRALLLLDVSASMYYPVDAHGKVRFACLAAACLAYMLTRQRDAVGIASFHETLLSETAIKSTQTHLRQLLVGLEQLMGTAQTKKKSHIADIIHTMAERVHKRSLLILFTDMLDSSENLDEVFSAIQHAKHNKHEVLLFHVYDSKSEWDFDFQDRPYRFVDLESGEEMSLSPSDYRKAYTEAVQKFYAEVKLRSAQYKIDFVEADIQKPIDQVLLPFLIKRSKMH